MIKLRLHPTTRLSIGLVALTISILLMGELIGVVPDKSQVVLDARKSLSETLAVQFAFAAEQEDFVQIEMALNLLVKRNPEILSAAMRGSHGSFFAIAGNHEAIWQNPSDSASSSPYVQVPIMQSSQLWGTVELSFMPLLAHNSWIEFKNSFWGMLLFVTVSGFLGYLIFLKRALKELNPSGVIPARVKLAFDTMTEGVLILDEKSQIVLANTAFCDGIGLDLDHLIGKEASSLNWEKGAIEQLKEDWTYPWIETLETMDIQTDVRLCLNSNDVRNQIFMVNCSPILGGDKQCKGVMVTFGNITELEDKNQKLQAMIERLEVTKNEVSRQNDELKILAEIDPLTGCFNRRAFHAHFDKIFFGAGDQDVDLNCIMLDIDHFKSVNDNFGHQTGDEVIKLVANIISDNMRDTDIVARYGGEEFCLILPCLDNETTLTIAEMIRVSVMNSTKYPIIGIKGVTISLGISSIKDGVLNPNAMIDFADKALYYAKNNGRNRVAVWRDVVKGDVDTSAPDKAVDECDSLLTFGENDSLDTDAKILHQKIKELEDLNDEQKKTFIHDLNFDSITGLPTRGLLLDRLNSAVSYAQRNKSSVAVLSLSFEAYKLIQGTLGYKAAEKLIVELSQKLSTVLRKTDTISSDIATGTIDFVLCRKNDDGFYVLIPELKEEQSITLIINRIYSIFNQPVIIEELNIKVDSAIGVSMFPIDGRDPDGLLKCADLARHYAETQGKSNCQFYSDKLNNLFTSQLEIESELERAIECNELEVYYQPIIDAKTGKISKLEALLRWNHPEKQFLSAMSFIDVAEKSGQIIGIGDWVLREAIQQLANWRRDISPNIFISVNISALQLRDDAMVENILKYLRENDVPPENLILEITETAIIQDMEHAIFIMVQLRDHGIQIALDDFGTGYSSLQYLQKFPIDIIKIDRSFVGNVESNESDASIVSMIISIAKKLGFTTVAEGVETEAQLKHLRNMGCNEIQGYLISRPIPKVPMCEMLEHQKSCGNKDKMKLVG